MGYLFEVGGFSELIDAFFLIRKYGDFLMADYLSALIRVETR